MTTIDMELKSQPRSHGFSLEGGRGGKTLSREGKVIFNFGIWLHHMKTGNIYIFFDKLDSRKATCYSQPPSFECHISLGASQDLRCISGCCYGKPKSQETVKQPPGEVEEDQGQDALFSCTNVGCIKVYQRQCSLRVSAC